MSTFLRTIQDSQPNFRGKDGKLYLVRCFQCDESRGRENYVLAASSGQCGWCGWKEAGRAEERP